jgi:hypothetical protein
MTTPRTRLILLIAIAAVTICGTSNAQTLIGSPGAGWQTWTVTPISSDQPDLNDSGAPWWDLQWAAAGSYGNSSGADKNPGFCITATGDCVGMASGAFAPAHCHFGQCPTIRQPTQAAPANKVYFREHRREIASNVVSQCDCESNEVNDFGWFETNATGTSVGTRHLLFSGTGVTKDQIPTPTGTSVVFTPTRYFGYYYSDVSEPACPDGTDPDISDPPCGDATLPLHGCYAYSLFGLNDQKCVDSTGGQGDHDFVIFKDGTPTRPNYWIAGEDPADCANADGDCNLTIVKVIPVFSN